MSKDINRDGEYRGVRFRLEAQAVAQAVAQGLPSGETFIGHYALLVPPSLSDDSGSVLPLQGVDDLAHPSIDRAWSTENEALNYATEAAHSAIELLLDGRTQGQGSHSVASQRRLAGE